MFIIVKRIIKDSMFYCKRNNFRILNVILIF